MLCWGAVRESQGQDKRQEEGVGGFGKDNFSQRHMIMSHKEANEQEIGEPDVQNGDSCDRKLKALIFWNNTPQM